MDEFIEIYNKNQKNIEIFIKESIYNIGDLKSKSNKKRKFTTLPNRTNHINLKSIVLSYPSQDKDL